VVAVLPNSQDDPIYIKGEVVAGFGRGSKVGTSHAATVHNKPAVDKQGHFMNLSVRLSPLPSPFMEQGLTFCNQCYELTTLEYAAAHR